MPQTFIHCTCRHRISSPQALVVASRPDVCARLPTLRIWLLICCYISHEIFDEQLRKQYTSRLPAENPLGNGETATYSFSDLDSPSKICVLQKLTEWIMVHPERLREKMEELKDGDQLGWVCPTSLSIVGLVLTLCCRE